MGCVLPEAMKYLVRLVKSITKLPVEVHTHNDFGMAVATELAGVEAGAEVVHSCANGLGERTGNAALEELIVALHVLYGYDTHYDLGKLPELGELVSRISRFDIALNKPILGDRNFTRESGIGVDLVVKEPLAMFGTHPALTGPARRSGAGKEERQGVHHLQPGTDGHHRRRRRSRVRDAAARERQRHREARLAEPGRVQGNRRRRTRCQALEPRRVTLTFDNGPEPRGHAGVVLDCLARHDIKATFFVMGRKAITAEGSALVAPRERGRPLDRQSHVHAFGAAGAAGSRGRAARIRASRAGAVVAGSGWTHSRTSLFRPPGSGQLGKHLLQPAVVEKLMLGGYTCVLWNSVPGDFRDPDGWLERALSDCQSRDWTLLVLHDLPNGAMAHLEEFIARTEG